MSEAYVLKALQTAVGAAVAASLDPTLKIKGVGMSFSPPSNGKWLSVYFTPNNPRGATIDATVIKRGILGLILHWPTSTAKVYDGVKLLESVLSYFEKGRQFTDNGLTIRVTNIPEITSFGENSSTEIAGTVYYEG